MGGSLFAAEPALLALRSRLERSGERSRMGEMEGLAVVVHLFADHIYQVQPGTSFS